MIALLRNQSLASVIIFCVGLFLFTLGLCHQEIIGFESRFYLFALEMWRHGATWFPTTNGVPYPDYPATTTLLIYGVAKLVGHLDKGVAVFPSAVAASLTLVTVYWIGALHDKRLGWFAVFFMLLTAGFLAAARTISPDQYVTLVTAVTFYLAESASVLKKCQCLWLLPLVLLFGFACRGPIGLIIPAAVLCVYYLVERNPKGFINAVIVSLVSLVVGAGILYCIADHAGGAPLVHEVLRMEVFGRLSEVSMPRYFYFTESLGAYALSYPLAVLITIGLLFQFRARAKSKDKIFLLKLIAWALIILMGMSLPGDKKIRYVLPIVPALALLCGYLFAAPQKQKYLNVLKQTVHWIIYFLPTFCLAIAVALKFLALQQHWHVHLLYIPIVILFFVMQWLVWIWRKSELRIVAVAAIAFVTFYMFLVEPINLMLNRTHNFVMSVEVLRYHNRAELVFYQENPDGLPIKYLVNLPREEKPVFINTPNELLAFNGRAYFVTDSEYFAKIPHEILSGSEIVSTGNIGHDTVVVFQKRVQ